MNKDIEQRIFNAFHECNELLLQDDIENIKLALEKQGLEISEIKIGGFFSVEPIVIILERGMIDELINDLDVISDYDKDNYQKLHYMKIEAVSKKGTNDGAALVDGRWIPKSQMKTDFDKNIFVTLWMYSKL